MREIPPLRPEPAPYRMVWLYENGNWDQDVDPLREREDGDVLQEYTDAGYRSPGKYAHPDLEVRHPVGPGQEADGLKLWVRDEHPQCLIEIEWFGATRVVYAARFPDGLDLMAKWAPIFNHAAPPDPTTRPARP